MFAKKTHFFFVTGVRVCPVSMWDSTVNEIRTDDNYINYNNNAF